METLLKIRRNFSFYFINHSIFQNHNSPSLHFKLNHNPRSTNILKNNVNFLLNSKEEKKKVEKILNENENLIKKWET